MPRRYKKVSKKRAKAAKINNGRKGQATLRLNQAFHNATSIPTNNLSHYNDNLRVSLPSALLLIAQIRLIIDGQFNKAISGGEGDKEAHQAYEKAIDECLCHHLATVGSSEIYNMGTKKTGLDTIHMRSYYKGARNDGKYWEDVFEQNTLYSVTETGESFYIDQMISQRTTLSLKYPWITATPDFICLVKYKNIQQLAVIEVKSHTSRGEYQAKTRPETQLKVAMSVFRVKLGFMVRYLYKKDDQNNRIFLEMKISEVTGMDFLDTNKDHIPDYITRLTGLVQIISGKCHRSRIREMVENRVKKNHAESPKTLDDVKKLPQIANRKKCNLIFNRRLGYQDDVKERERLKRLERIKKRR